MVIYTPLNTMATILSFTMASEPVVWPTIQIAQSASKMFDLIIDTEQGRKYCKRLKPGDVLEPSDFYKSSSDLWEPIQTPGAVIKEGLKVEYVRPEPEDEDEDFDYFGLDTTYFYGP